MVDDHDFLLECESTFVGLFFFIVRTCLVVFVVLCLFDGRRLSLFVSLLLYLRSLGLFFYIFYVVFIIIDGHISPGRQSVRTGFPFLLVSGLEGFFVGATDASSHDFYI